ncbi:SRPBCC domain-containing protein [Streptomyces sp. NPDC021224]|uniref:SRPBCC domain-containing protein n=1 Tax=unclassified Streptomyces TaxID=2593676 RepID=UPI0037BA266C
METETNTRTEYGSIEREIRIEATPEVVFDVVSSPEHLREWWPDEVDLPGIPGTAGRIGFRKAEDGEIDWMRFTVVDAVPPRLFSFRWTHPEGEAARQGNSHLVVFELEAAGDGATLLRMTETGFRERGWSEAEIADQYGDHSSGWNHFLPRLVGYAARVQAGR